MGGLGYKARTMGHFCR